jgi:cobalt-zinc-cadmium efflux system protein
VRRQIPAEENEKHLSPKRGPQKRAPKEGPKREPEESLKRSALSHDHSHASHLGHSHATIPGGSHEARRGHARKLMVVLGLSGTYMFAEAAGGLITGSLALLADAGHLLSDVASLVLGLFAIRIAQRPATATRTYGHTRVEILAALAQGVALVAVALMISLEAVERFGSIREVNGLGMVAVASGALLVNSIGMLVLSSGRHESINIRGVWLHVASDALGSLGVIAAGLAIWLFGWLWADPAVSLLISALVLFAAWQLMRDAVDILMESAPGHLDIEEIRSALSSLTEVASVHDLHVWTIGNGEIALSSHLVSPPGGDPAGLLHEARGLLGTRFSIHHSTVQIEVAEGADPDCEGACDPPQVAATGS